MKWLKWIGIILAVSGVIAHRELPNGWYLLTWIPITIGYGLFYIE